VSFFKKVVFTIGVLTILYILSTIFQLKDPDGPRIIDPSNPVQLPHVSVSK
jgi:hypothetical protein